MAGLYTYFSEPYDINNPADVAKYALPTTGEGDFIVEYLTIPWVFWLLLFLCFASVNVLSAYHKYEAQL